MKILQLFVALFFAASLCSEMPSSSYAILGASLFDGTGRAVLKNAALLIKDNKIVAMGTTAQLKIPPHTRIIDAKGKWLIPGLIDAHIHFFQSAGLYARPDILDLRAKKPYSDEIAWVKNRIPFTMSRYICSGITSVVDLGGSFWTLSLPAQFAQNKAAPRISATGPLLSTYIPPELAVADPPIIAIGTPKEARKKVQEILQRGADLIKIWFIQKGTSALKEESIKAAIDEAHAHQKRVVVHATELPLARFAVEAGADILAHSVGDQVIDSDFIKLLKEKNVIYIPTLQVEEGYHDVLEGEFKLNALDQVCGDKEVIATWHELLAPQYLGSKDRAIAEENLRLLAREGVKIAAGSDAGNIGTLHGSGLFRELKLMAAAGLSPKRVLLAATRDAALVTNSRLVGTIEVGKLADIVILNGDPLSDINNVANIDTVIKNGEIIPIRSSLKWSISSASHKPSGAGPAVVFSGMKGRLLHNAF